MNTDFLETSTLETVLIKITQMAEGSDVAEAPPREEISLLRNAGLLEITLPGEPLDFLAGNTSKLLDVLKAVGKSNLSIGRIYEGHVNAIYLIHLFASHEQKSHWYEQVKMNQALFGVWNTEAAKGITLNSENQSIRVSGQKTFCSGAALVTHGLITGAIETESRKGWQMLIVEMDKIPAVNIDTSSWKTLGMRASGSFTVDFSSYIAKENDLLGEPEDYLKQPYFNGGAIRFAAVQLGGIEAIAKQTLDYLSMLNRTSDPIQNMRVSTIMVAVNSGRMWIKQAGNNFDDWVEQPDKSADLIAFANMTRTAIEEIGTLVMKESNQCIGARGLMYPHPFERFYRDLSFYLRQPAPDSTRLNVAAYYFDKNKKFGDV